MRAARTLATCLRAGSPAFPASPASASSQGVRRFGATGLTRDLRTDGGGEAEDFIERSLDQASKQGAKKREASPSEVLTTKREALSLYRAVWRASFLFVWRNEKGEEWRDVIRESARKEFEASRHEKDPEMVARLLLTGRDYLDQAMQKFVDKRQKIIDDEKGAEGGGDGGAGR